MAGDWIPATVELPRKREILLVAERTGRSRHEVIGLMIDFWLWVSSESDDGRVPGIHADVLPNLIGADTEFWRQVMVVGWLIDDATEGLGVPRADHWLSRAAKARLQKNRRQQVWRNSNGHDVDGDVDAPAPTTEQNRTEQNSVRSGPVRSEVFSSSEKGKTKEPSLVKDLPPADFSLPDWPELAALAEKPVAPLPAKSLEFGVFHPLRLTDIRSDQRVIEWHARQLSAHEPVAGGTQAHRALVLSAAIHVNKLQDREIKKGRVALFVGIVKNQRWKSCRGSLAEAIGRMGKMQEGTT